MTEPCDLSAVEARRLIGEKKLSPVELLDSCIARIDAVDPAVNAMVATCYPRAREEARAAELAVIRGETLGPLHGLPLGVKDLNLTEGLRTTFGSLIYQDYIPDHDEGLIAALRGAGAIVIGKTNTPEFGAGANTVNKVYGATRNPFDTARTCAGSSGGSAVALATGMAPLCTGSDTGGSLRTRAAFCGVSSIRPTPGVVASETRAVGLTTFGVQGPMARSIPDAALMLSTIAGFGALDPLSAPLDGAAFAAVPEADLGTLRVAVSEDLGFARIDQRIRETFRARTAKFRSLFKDCTERDPALQGASEVFWILRGVTFLANHGERYEKHRDLLGENVRGNVEDAAKMTAHEIGWANAEQTRLYRDFQRFFDDIDLLICPAAAVPPFPVEQLYCAEIDGVKLPNYISWLDITSAITLTGHPVAVVPCGYEPTGTPFGLQIVGPRRHSDASVIAAAAALETAFAADPDLARPVPDIAALTGVAQNSRS
ncbi:MAG: amidase [Proteobacteria bacterium]|nr:amidase [Pseudomonadota bacterium]